MLVRNEAEGRFQSEGSLLSWRYGLLVAGALAWLWEVETALPAALAAGMFSVVLLLELPLHPPRPFVSDSRRTGLAFAQLLLALVAQSAAPGIGSSLFIGGVLSGLASVTPASAAAVALTLSAAAGAASLPIPAGSLFVVFAVYGLATGIGVLSRHRDREARALRAAVDDLQAAHRRIAAFSETVSELAAAEERQRVAEELHDTLGHALVGTLLQVQVAGKELLQDPAAARSRLRTVEANVRDTLEQVRVALRRSARRRAQLPLPLALQAALADFADAGGPATQLSLLPDAEAVSDVDPETADVLFRTTQEALTNAVRHGRAQNVHVELEAAGRRIYLRIRDDGVGAEQYTPGMGLTGMVGRVQGVGGTIRFQTAPKAGFMVEVGVKRQ